MTQPVSSHRRIATSLFIGARSGWGVFGCNMGMQLAARGIEMVAMGECDFDSLLPRQRAALVGIEASRQIFVKELNDYLAAGRGREIRFDGDFLHCLGDDLIVKPLGFDVRAKRTFGSLFLENSGISPEGIARGKCFDKILAGSTWNAGVLRKHGLENVAVALQGVDGDLFFPGERKNPLPGRFIIFSGGKLEYRKGQDLVIAAYKKFAPRHPDALLLFAWHNGWPRTMEEITAAGLVPTSPTVIEDGAVEFTRWLAGQGVERFIDAGQPLNWQTPDLLREADVGLFPNRCEGGTNLVAMECMACGVPTILSANTGHLDLINGENCFPLVSQGPVRPTKSYPHVEGWGESSIDEIVEKLEFVYADRAEARRRGLAGANTMRQFRWENQIGKLLDAMGPPDAR